MDGCRGLLALQLDTLVGPPLIQLVTQFLGPCLGSSLFRGVQPRSAPLHTTSGKARGVFEEDGAGLARGRGEIPACIAASSAGGRAMALP